MNLALWMAAGSASGQLPLRDEDEYSVIRWYDEHGSRNTRVVRSRATMARNGYVDPWIVMRAVESRPSGEG